MNEIKAGIHLSGVFQRALAVQWTLREDTGLPELCREERNPEREGEEKSVESTQEDIGTGADATATGMESSGEKEGYRTSRF
jgi:hypothetical protein